MMRGPDLHQGSTEGEGPQLGGAGVQSFAQGRVDSAQYGFIQALKDEGDAEHHCGACSRPWCLHGYCFCTIALHWLGMPWVVIASIGF